MGGTSSGLPLATSVFLPSGVFGLAMASGDATGVGTVYYSETSKNADGYVHRALLSLKAFRGDDCDVVSMWEDLADGGDNDHNDDAVRVQNMETVPEPATMAIIGAGILAAARKRRAR